VIFLFDIDGTLLLSGGAGRIALERATDLHLPRADAMDRVTCAGKTDLLIVEDACRHVLGVDPDDETVDRILTSYAEFLPQELAANPSFRLMPGVPRVLHALRRRKDAHLAVATGNIEFGARLKLQRAGLDHLLPLGGYGDDCRDRTVILRRAMDAVASHAGRPLDELGPTIVIGDTVLDIEAARRLDLHAVVLGGTTTPEATLAEANPDLLVDDLRELLPWSKKLRYRRRKAAPSGQGGP